MGLWFAFLGPPLLWTLHLVVGYGYEEAACDNATGIGAVEPLIVAATALLGAATALAAVAGVRVLRAIRSGRRTDARGRVAFMSWIGVAWSPIFLFAIVLGGVQLVTLEPCTAA